MRVIIEFTMDGGYTEKKGKAHDKKIDTLGDDKPV